MQLLLRRPEGNHFANGLLGWGADTPMDQVTNLIVHGARIWTNDIKCGENEWTSKIQSSSDSLLRSGSQACTDNTLVQRLAQPRLDLMGSSSGITRYTIGGALSYLWISASGDI